MRIVGQLNDLIQQVPMSASALGNLATKQLLENPELIWVALRHRLKKQLTGPEKKTTYNFDSDVSSAVQELASKLRLSGDEIIRLAIEAYLINTDRL